VKVKGGYLRSFDVAETCSVNLHVWICFECDVTDLCPDMLAFTVAISPDEKDRSISCLSLDIARHDLFVLDRVSLRTSEPNAATNLSY
jgi:hypothetical protein